MPITRLTQTSIKQFVKVYCADFGAALENNIASNGTQSNRVAQVICKQCCMMIEILSHSASVDWLSLPALEYCEESSRLKERIQVFLIDKKMIMPQVLEIVLAFCRKNERLNAQISWFDRYFRPRAVVKALIDELIRAYSFSSCEKLAFETFKRSRLVNGGLNSFRFSPAFWGNSVSAVGAALIIGGFAGTFSHYSDKIIHLFIKYPAAASLLSSLAIPLITFLISTAIRHIVIAFRLSADARTRTHCLGELLENSPVYWSLYFNVSENELEARNRLADTAISRRAGISINMQLIQTTTSSEPMIASTQLSGVNSI